MPLSRLEPDQFNSTSPRHVTVLAHKKLILSIILSSKGKRFIKNATVDVTFVTHKSDRLELFSDFELRCSMPALIAGIYASFILHTGHSPMNAKLAPSWSLFSPGLWFGWELLLRPFSLKASSALPMHLRVCDIRNFEPQNCTSNISPSFYPILSIFSWMEDPPKVFHSHTSILHQNFPQNCFRFPTI